MFALIMLKTNDNTIAMIKAWIFPKSVIRDTAIMITHNGNNFGVNDNDDDDEDDTN